jgi:hypothetical protein
MFDRWYRTAHERPRNVVYYPISYDIDVYALGSDLIFGGDSTCSACVWRIPYLGDWNADD